MDKNTNLANNDKPLVGIKEKIKNFFRKITNDKDGVNVNSDFKSRDTTSYRDDLKMY